jgi:glycosyltransferase involved in cell wall biosynthesis
MRIALFLERDYDGTGGFHDAFSKVESLTRNNSIKHDFVVFTSHEKMHRLLLKEGIEAIQFKLRGYRLIDRWSATVVGSAILRRLRRLGLNRLGRHLDALLDDHNIDLVILTECGEIALCIGDHPFIITVWDQFNRDLPDFPEVFSDRHFEFYERVPRATLSRALAVIADSPAGARRIASLYKVNPKRIIVLPFLPSLAVRRHAAGAGTMAADRVRRKYDLPARYVFYPAYFSYHKNHLYVLEGLLELERRHGIILHAVFCGGGESKWEREGLERKVRALGLTDRVRFLGFVPDEEIPALYEGALALVMPTYSGPANLPPLEAITLGCPLIYSDLPEFREQMGDAALYCNLADSSSLADQLTALIKDTELLAHVRKAGSRLVAEMAKIDYSERLGPILDNYAYIRRRWTWPETQK